MLDVALLIRIVLNVASILFFVAAYRKIKYAGLLMLAIQCILSLSLRVWAAFFYVDPLSDWYNYILIGSNVINLIAAYYLYNSIREFKEGK